MNQHVSSNPRHTIGLFPNTFPRPSIEPVRSTLRITMLGLCIVL